jgi:hypothetical protein
VWQIECKEFVTLNLCERKYSLGYLQLQRTRHNKATIGIT